MQYKLGLYEKAMPNNLSWEEKIKTAKKIGYDYLEMSIDESYDKISRLDWDEDQIIYIRNIQIKENFFIESICLSAQRKYPLGSQKWENESINLVKKAIIFAKKMGIRYIMLQGYDCYYDEISNQNSKIRFNKNLKEVTKFAALEGITLGIETMENDFMNTIKKVMDCIKYINSPYLMVYPDLGNITNATNNILKDIEFGKGYILAVHLKETIPGKFREVPYGKGNVDFSNAILKFYSQGVHRYVSECWYCGEENWEDILINNLNFLNNKFNYS